jgi:hypothetical protein
MIEEHAATNELYPTPTAIPLVHVKMLATDGVEVGLT